MKTAQKFQERDGLEFKGDKITDIPTGMHVYMYIYSFEYDNNDYKVG